jgi:hypothetical protein
MDPEKIFKFLTENIPDWLRVMVLTLARPISLFELVVTQTEGSSIIVGRSQSGRQLWLHPKLITFALLSIVLGTTINAQIPHRIIVGNVSLVPSVVIIIIYWFCIASLEHLLCRLLQGKGRYLETVSVIIQVFATLYVAASFLALIAATVLTLRVVAQQVEKTVPLIGQLLVEDPVNIFFLISTVLLIVYIPLALRSVHRFGWIQTMITSLFPLFTAPLAVVIYYKYGIFLMK